VDLTLVLQYRAAALTYIFTPHPSESDVEFYDWQAHMAAWSPISAFVNDNQRDMKLQDYAHSTRPFDSPRLKLDEIKLKECAR
jgi:hypothetical protein